MRSLNKLMTLRRIVLDLRRKWLVKTKGVNVHPGASISLSATLVSGEPGAISIDDGTLVAFKSLLIATTTEGVVQPIHIGKNCFIGGGAVILPGVTIGDECVIGSGAIVRDDVPPRCIAAGNPARILSQNIEVGRFGRFKYADENQDKYD